LLNLQTKHTGRRLLELHARGRRDISDAGLISGGGGWRVSVADLRCPKANTPAIDSSRRKGVIGDNVA
jgi:hypothetical protein